MAVTKIRKISSWTLLISAIISIVILVMFFAGGVVDPAAELKEPVYTGLLINWVAVMFFASIICTLLFAVWQFANLLKTDSKAAIMSLVVLICFAAILLISYAMGDPTPLTGLNADSQSYNTAMWLKITDMWLISIVILVVLIVACAIWGSIKKIMGK